MALKVLVAGLSRPLNDDENESSIQSHAPNLIVNGGPNETVINEITILERLSKLAPSSLHSGSAFVLSLLDHFTTSGPNGVHHVIVTEVTGPRISTLQRTGASTRELCRQLLQGVDYIHQYGITHGGELL